MGKQSPRKTLATQNVQLNKDCNKRKLTAASLILAMCWLHAVPKAAKGDFWLRTVLGPAAHSAINFERKPCMDRLWPSFNRSSKVLSAPLQATSLYNSMGNNHDEAKSLIAFSIADSLQSHKVKD
jgi:hypothetical protein